MIEKFAYNKGTNLYILLKSLTVEMEEGYMDEKIPIFAEY